MYSRRITPVILSIAVTLVVACQTKQSGPTALPTAAVTRADINVRVQATGTVEPINPVPVESRAQGMVTKMNVDVGSVVKAGDPLLIVEAMKTMNQIPAPRGGTVTQILIEDGQPVEYGEPLMIVE